MYYDAFGRPVMPGMTPGMMGEQMSPDTVQLAREIIKREKADRKAEKRKEEKKSKATTFGILEMWGVLMLASIPTVLCQIWALDIAKEVLKNSLK